MVAIAQILSVGIVRASDDSCSSATCRDQAGRAIFLENSQIVPIAWAPWAKVQAKKVTGHLPRLVD